MSLLQVGNSRSFRSRWTRWLSGALIFGAGLGVAVACGGDGGGTGTTPDYGLTLSAAALSILPGANQTTTVTIDRNNFTGEVTLGLAGAPAGVTGSFEPAAPTGNSSTLTVSVGDAVAPGLYHLTVTGTGTAGDRTTALTLTVTGPADYALTLDHATASIVQGGNGTAAVTLTRTNFTGAVTLSLGGAPAGVTGDFAPAAPTGTTSTLTITVAGSVAAGVYNLTVDGTGSAGDRSTPLVLTVTAAAADYSLSLSAPAFTVAPGATGTSVVTITRTNFAGAVTLSVGGAPAGVTGAFAPAAPTGTTSTLTLTVGAGVAAGSYNLTVDGTGTAGNHSTPLTLTVSVAPSYSLALSSAAMTVVQGATGTSTVTLTRSNFAGAVTLSLSGAPAGVTGAFAPAAPTGTTSTLTVTVGALVAPGLYNLTVDGTGTAGNHSTPLALTVSAAPTYELSVAPDTLAIVQGSNSTTAVTIARTNFAGAVTLSLTGAPAGVTSAFAPAAPTGTSSTLTVTVGAAVAAGFYPLSVNGTGTPGARATTLILNVTAAAANYSLSAAPDSIDVVQAATGTSTITLTRTNFAGAVTLSLGGAPNGMTGAFVAAAPTGTSSTLTVTVGGAVTAGIYHLTVNGTGTPGARSTPLTVKVIGAAANYALSLSSATMSVAKGSTGVVTVNLARTNFAGAVTLSLTGTPAGVTGAFAPPAPTGANSTLTVTVGSSVATGVYHLLVAGTGTPGARNTALTLTVTGAAGGNVTIDVSACLAADRPTWLAYQDGSGPWVVSTPVSNVYHINLTNPKAGLAYVVLASSDNQTTVDYRTTTEATSGPIVLCTPPDPVGKTIHGTTTGLAATDQTFVHLGGALTFASSAVPAFTLSGVEDGVHDLVAYRNDPVGTNDEILIRRDLNPADGATLAPVRFDSAEAHAPATAVITIAGLTGTETAVGQFTTYNTGANCDAANLSSGTVGGTTFTAVGAPSGIQRASDLHQVAVTASAGPNAGRFTIEYFHTMAARTLTLGAVLPVPTISTLTGPYKRLQAAFTLPADYNSSAGFSYRETSSGNGFAISASPAYLATSAVTLAAPDFSALAGWNNSWAPSSAATGDWTVSGVGGTTGGLACVEGGGFKSAQQQGTF